MKPMSLSGVGFYFLVGFFADRLENTIRIYDHSGLD